MKYSANLISCVPAPSVTETDSGLSMQSATPAAALRAVAGSPSGLYQTRRGSFMILVVGTLALLAVITLLYVGIGRSDRAGAAATVRSHNTESVPEAFKDYAAQVIADGAISMFEPGAFVTAINVPPSQREFIRKTWDYPSTDWRLQTYVTDPDDARYFTPTGGRSGTTPFLASADPTWLNYNNGNDPLPAPKLTSQLWTEVYKNYNDWTHISNFAPDGAFVNLYNLRNKFDATPRQMRQNLFTIDLLGAAQNTTEFGRSIYFDAGAPANPADMSMRQANLFREVKALNGAAVNNTHWLSYSYCDNDGDGMYDGRYFELRDWRDTSTDAFRSLLPQDQNYRWVFSSTCIDLTGKVNINTATDFFYQEVAPPAAPGAAQPNADLPVGVTPAEVDLLRLLSMYDVKDLYNKSYADFNQPNRNDRTRTSQNYGIMGGGGPGGGANTGYVIASAPKFGKLSYDWIRQSVNDSLMLRTSIGNYASYTYTFATPIERYSEYLLHAGRSGETSASGGAAPNYSSSGGFQIADLIELLTYRGMNDPAAESRFEAITGGRAKTFQNDRLSPLRSNRDLEVERDSVDIDRNERRLQAVADIRHNLSPVSGARDLRPGTITPLSGFVPPALGAGDVKLDAQGMLATHDNAPIVLPLANANASDWQRLDARGRAEHDLFLGYANALCPPLPVAIRPNAWRQQNDALAQAVRTRFYGYGSAFGTGNPANLRLAPQLPLLASAFMAVNMIDAFDGDKNQFSVRILPAPPNPSNYIVDPMENAPTVKTLLFSDRFRTQLMLDYVGTPAGNEPVDQPDPKPYDTSDLANNGGRAYPWSHWVEPGRIGQFDLNAESDSNVGKAVTNRLFGSPMTNSTATSPLVPAMNVYGIEAQPFITQIANLTVYTDTPFAKDGDNDEDGTPTMNPDGSFTYDDTLTIKGDLPTNEAWSVTTPGANADVVCRVVAFQLANPFDHRITLSYGGPSSLFVNADAIDAAYPEIDRERDFYYIEYCNNFYKMAVQVDEPAPGGYSGKTTLRPLVIDPGKSIVVYSLNRSAKVIADRWKDLGMDMSSGQTVEQKVTAWLRAQFSETGEVYQVPRFKPSENTDADSGKVLTSFNPEPVTRTSDPNQITNRYVHLWRAQRAADLSVSNPDHEGSRETRATVAAGVNGTASPGDTLIWARNARENDRLVDRFVAKSDMSRQLQDGDNDLQGAPGGSETGTEGDVTRNANTGITFMLWSAARRPGYNGLAPADQPVGVIPPWCVEPKSDAELTSWNKLETDGLDVADSTISLDEIRTAEGGGSETFALWYDKTVQGQLVGDMRLSPEKWIEHPIGTDQSSPPDYHQVSGELFLDNEQFLRVVQPSGAVVSTIRLADMLKPFCMGPFETPVKSSGPTTFVSYPQAIPTSVASVLNVTHRWVTLSQVLAVAYGYDSISKPGTVSGASSELSGLVLGFYKPYDVTPPAPDPAYVRRMQVGGHIVLDDFVPFNDAQLPNNREFDPAANGEYRTGMGVPLAMNILDNFTMASTLSGLTRAKPGLINLNTATRSVLSCVPMLSPPGDDAISGTTWWWPLSAGTTRLDSRTDIVATLMGYRDKIPYEVRPAARDASMPARDVRFFGDRLWPDDQTGIGRDAATSIRYIQESPGLRSVGELLAARMRFDYTDAQLPLDNASNIDFRGYLADPGANQSLTRAGVASVCYRDSSNASDPADKPGESINSFNNKVDIANAAMTASTVRSDYFAVYFTVQGYQKADVDNLQPADPMVPSIKRRFLMIVDRSNVVKVGDKPRILAFKELPN